MLKSDGVTVVVIPARGGSKGLPGKNVARVGGIPLIKRAVYSAAAAQTVDAVVVTTDDDVIAGLAEEAGARVIARPPELAGDDATSESAVLHALAEYQSSEPCAVGVVVLVQATSPFIDARAIDRAVDRVRTTETDVVFSAVKSHAFIWGPSDTGLRGVNHDSAMRLRRQDLPVQYRETGAWYVMDAEGFVRAGHRFFGAVGAVEVDPATAIDIDDAGDLAAAQALASLVDTADSLAARALVTDFDGVHTDDTVRVCESGAESVAVSRADGMGLAALRTAGVPVLILSKERNPVVGARGAKLGIETKQAIDDKLTVLRDWAVSHRLRLSDVAYVGNDINDLPCLEAVGWPIAVPNAHPSVIRASRLVLARPGGRGALRDVADRILSTMEQRHV